jgi:hypothetical protein
VSNTVQLDRASFLSTNEGVEQTKASFVARLVVRAHLAPQCQNGNTIGVFKENIVKKHKSIWRILAFLLLLNTVETVHAGQQKKFADPDRGLKIDDVSAAAVPVSDHVLSAGIQTQEPVYNELAGPKKECWIGEDHYFIYRFVDPPKMGTAILKIELFDKNDQRVTDLNIVGMSDMPSMRGAHDSGEVAFKLNKKGDYLLPVNIVMAGEWEIKLHFLKGTDVIYRGSFKFHV